VTCADTGTKAEANRAADRQPEPQAAGFERDEGLEQAGADLVGDARAIVGDPDPYENALDTRIHLGGLLGSSAAPGSACSHELRPAGDCSTGSALRSVRSAAPQVNGMCLR
jgi:hypothetical protein